nr:N [Spodoptera frugiperda rhabdovirus] [Spodoptera frugiperda rhabdovirus]
MILTLIDDNDYFTDIGFLDLIMTQGTMKPVWEELGTGETEFQGTVDIPGRSLKPEKTDWSVDTCREISLNLKLPGEIWQLAHQETIFNRFLTFYATGYVPNTHTATEIVLSMASLIFKDKAKAPIDLIWDDSFQASPSEECGFSVVGETPLVIGQHPDDDDYTLREDEESAAMNEEEKIQAALKTLGIQDTPVDLKDASGIVFETKEDREQRIKNEKALHVEDDINALTQITKQFLFEYSTGSLQKFVAKATTIFIDNNATNGFTRLHLHAIRVMNFIALTMLRKVTKSNAQMINAFLKEQYKRNIASLIPGALSSDFAPPSKSCIDKLTAISKNDPAVSSFFAKVVMLNMEEERRNPSLVACLGASLLTHTTWNGMGILHVIFEVCLFHQISWKRLVTESLTSLTKMSWGEVSQFLIKYQAKGNPDPTVAWARIIDDSYFMRLTIVNHPTLAALLVESLIRSQKDDGILNANWAIQHRDTINYYRDAAKLLTDKLTGQTATVQALTNEAADLVRTMNAGPSRYHPRPSTLIPMVDLNPEDL